MRARILLIALVFALCVQPGAPGEDPRDYEIFYIDEPDEGFFHPELGPDRRAALEYALDLWTRRLLIEVPIHVEVGFVSLGGTADSALLAQTGILEFFESFEGALEDETWYVPALAEQMAGENFNNGNADFFIEFNQDIDTTASLGETTWYYGLDANPPDDDIDFVTTCLHELTHGLGFFDLFRPNDAAWFGGVPDAFSRQLTWRGVGDFVDLTEGQRLAAIVDDSPEGGVFWLGPLASDGLTTAPRMHTPGLYQTGSSVSHWAEYQTTPSLLMEPSYRIGHDLDITPAALFDIGWEPFVNRADAYWHLY